MRELVNHRAAVPQNPELCRGWDPINVIDSEAQRPEPGRKPDQRGNKLWEGLGGLPACLVACLVIGDCLINFCGVRKERLRQAINAIDSSPLATPRVAQFRWSCSHIIG